MFLYDPDVNFASVLSVQQKGWTCHPVKVHSNNLISYRKCSGSI